MDDVISHKTRLIPSTRFLLSILGFLGCVCVYSVRVNMSVALVCMVNHTAILTSNNDEFSNPNASYNQAQCRRESSLEESSETEDGEFLWSKEVQGMILGSFFWGYITSQILGGWLAQRFGARIVQATNVGVGALLTFLTPLAARTHYGVLIALRVALGIIQGSTYPGFHVLWSHWAPPMENSMLIGITYAGTQMGNVIAMPISGVLCKHGFAGGWPSVFYVFGLISVVWVILWLSLASDTPLHSKTISKAEKAYIVSSLAHKIDETDHSKRLATPWKSVLTSIPVWACVIGHIAGDWGAYTMLTCLPSFLKDVLQFDMTSLGFLASIPYIAYFFCINLGGFIADFLRRKGYLSTLNTRKLMMILSLGGQAVFLVSAGYCKCGQEMLVIVLLTLGMGLSGFQYAALGSQAIFMISAGYCKCGQELLVIGLLTLGMGLSGFQYAGFVVNYMDIAPAFAGPVCGIGNMLSCLGGIFAPYLMGVLTPDKTREQWLTLFFITAGILIFGALVFSIFSSADVQSWALPDQGVEMEQIHLAQELEKSLEEEEVKGHEFSSSHREPGDVKIPLV